MEEVIVRTQWCSSKFHSNEDCLRDMKKNKGINIFPRHPLSSLVLSIFVKLFFFDGWEKMSSLLICMEQNLGSEITVSQSVLTYVRSLVACPCTVQGVVKKFLWNNSSNFQSVFMILLSQQIFRSKECETARTQRVNSKWKN